MAAIYFLCGREVTTKKGERFVVYLLCKDGYGSPSVRDFWLDSESEIADQARELMPGVAVRCQTVFGNERQLAFIEEDEAPPLLDLTAFFDTSLNGRG